MTPVKTRVVEVAPAPEEGWWSLLQRSVEHAHILTLPSFLSTHRLCPSTWVVYSGGKSVIAATGIKSKWIIWPLWKPSRVSTAQTLRLVVDNLEAAEAHLRSTLLAWQPAPWGSEAAVVTLVLASSSI